MKVVINKCYGGFGLSDEAEKMFQQRKGTQKPIYSSGIERNDPDLIAIVETLGIKADNDFSKLKIIEIPDDVDFCVEEYDGIEWITDKNRRWE